MASKTKVNSKISDSPIKRFMSFIELESQDVTLIYSYAILGGLIGLSLPLGIQSIMSLILSREASASWFLLMTLIIFSIAFSGSLQIMQMTISERLQQRLMVNAAFDFAFRVPRWKLEMMQKQYPPELMNRIFDVINIQKSLSKILIDFSTSFLQILFGLTLLAFYHAYFALFGIFTFLVIIIIFILTFSKGLETSLMESKYKYKIASWLEELARTMGIVKLAGYTDMHLKKTDKFVKGYVQARKDHFKVLKFQYANIVAFKTILTGGLLIIGSLLVIYQQITIAQFVASEIIIILIVSSVEKLMVSIETIYDILTAFEKIGQIDDIELESEDGVSFEEIDTGKGVEIILKDVSYSYPETNRITLKNLNLNILAGDKICVAGFPGSGKTTLINLAATMLHNYQGTITFNKITLKNLNLISLRSYVGENLAKKELILGTIAENISMGRDDISFQDIRTATDAVGLTEYIQSTEKGFHTIIVPEDITVPSSIVKKITMARSIAEKPHLFLLDDFLGGLERKDKHLIVDALTGTDKFWTLLGASNERIFASKCNKIIVLKDGEIFDRGTYDEISKKPYFDELFIP